jgi:hypothetical protein
LLILSFVLRHGVRVGVGAAFRARKVWKWKFWLAKKPPFPLWVAGDWDAGVALPAGTFWFGDWRFPSP